jgi:hypothetical protein
MIPEFRNQSMLRLTTLSVSTASVLDVLSGAALASAAEHDAALLRGR